jgi:hypothetical protein
MVVAVVIVLEDAQHALRRRRVQATDRRAEVATKDAQVLVGHTV